MRRIVKNTNDFILGTIFLILGLFLLLNPNVASKSMSKMGGILTQASTYLHMLGGILAVASIGLILSSLYFGKENVEKKKFAFHITREALITAAALILYCFLMPIVTFFPATFVLIFGLNLLYKHKEGEKQEKKTGDFRYKEIMASAVYAVIMTILLWAIFTKLLSAILP